MPEEHAAYLAKPDYIVCTANTKKDYSPSTAPRHDDPLSRHRLSYLSGVGGSGKTTRAIELFRQRDPLVFTPTHRLSKEMRARGVQAQTYHSFSRWSGQKEWTAEKMGQKFIPRVIIWDEVCTVARLTLETFLDWLEGRGVQVICCGDQGQPHPIAGEIPHDWLRDRTQKLLFERHEEYFPDTSVPLFDRPEDTRRQNIMVTIPGPSPEGRPNQQELVLNDVVEVPLKYAGEVLGGMWDSDWALGYSITVHSSQGLTIADP